MEWTERPAGAEDEPAIFRMSREIIDKYEDLRAIDYPRVLDWVQQNIKDSIVNYRAVLVDGETAGYYCLTPGEGGLELDGLYLLPEFQSQGIGTEILRACMERAGVEEQPLRLFVFRANKGAVRLYRRMGFETIAEVGNTRLRMEYHAK